MKINRLVVHGRDRDDLADAGRAGDARELERTVGPLDGGDLPIDGAAALDERHLLAGLRIERVRQPPVGAIALGEMRSSRGWGGSAEAHC